MTDLSEKEKENWKGGETGFISSAMVQKHAPDFNGAAFFVAGPPKFNFSMRNMLKEELKIPEKNIILENFSGY